MRMTVRSLQSGAAHGSYHSALPKVSYGEARDCAWLAAAVGLALALGGCFSVADQVSAEIETRREACRQQTFRTNVERARCHNAAEARLGEVWGADLAAVRSQTRLVIADKTDRKQLTEAEAELEFAKANYTLTTEAMRRRQAQQSAEAQYEAAMAQRRLRAMQSQPALSGSIECVTRPGPGEIRTECRDKGVGYYNPAIQYQ
jgi:hypothetical protein